MSQAYVPIQTVTVGSGGSTSVTFSNIPQTYTDLMVKASVRSIDTSVALGYDPFLYRVNSLTSGYSGRQIMGNGASASSDTQATRTSDIAGGTWGRLAINGINNGNTTTNTFSSVDIYFPNYTSSNGKSVSCELAHEGNGTTYYTEIITHLNTTTSAITSIAFACGVQYFAQYSTFTLYGIGGARASGGTITSDSRYTYHTFTSSGTFTALEKIKGAEMLIIAGGGGGGMNAGSGGGAGGVAYGTSQTLNSGTSYSIIVGAGGNGTSGSSGSGASGSQGSNSLFGSATALGGGAGGYHALTSAASGGSGAGGVSSSGGSSMNGGSATQTSGTNYIGYGNAGGNGAVGAYVIAGGGGGAGAVGSNATSSVGGDGGNGTSLFSSWAYATSTGVLSTGVYYYAGGGGGASDPRQSGFAHGSGGLGGGGAAARTATAGTANTGGGGGGSAFGNGSSQSSGAGGSGLVIIRYPN